MPDCLGLSCLFRVGPPLGLSLLCPRNVLGGEVGDDTRCRAGAVPATSLRRRERRRFFWITEEMSNRPERSGQGRRASGHCPRTSRRGAPHGPVLGEAEERLPRLGSVAAPGGHAAGWHGGGFWCMGAGVPCPPRDCGTAWGPFSCPTSGHRKCRTGALHGRAPRSWISSSSSSPHSFPESSSPQAEGYKFRAGLAEVGRKEARTGSGGCHSDRGGQLLPRLILPLLPLSF